MFQKRTRKKIDVFSKRKQKGKNFSEYYVWKIRSEFIYCVNVYAERPVYLLNINNVKILDTSRYYYTIILLYYNTSSFAEISIWKFEF